MAIGTYISIVTLNVNRLNASTKRHRLAKWIQKQDPYICCLQETHFRPKDTYKLKVRGRKNIFHANRKEKKAGLAILTSNKIDLKVKNITRDKKGHYITDSNTVIVGDFNIPLSPMDRSSKPKINKETQVLNDTLDEMDLIDIRRTFHPNAEEYTFFSSAYGTFSRIDHIFSHKSNLSKFKEIEMVSSIFSNHNAMRPNINYKRKTVRNTSTWRD